MATQTSNIDRQCIQAFSTKIDCLAEKDRNQACIPNTGQWFFNQPTYRLFLDNDAPQVLFVTAEAGSGKSTIMRTVIDKFESFQPSPLIAYFFFKDDNDLQRSYSEALAAIIHQLLSQRPALAVHASQSYQQHGQGVRNQPAEMWKILVAVAVHAQEDIICVLDAIDECGTEGRSQLLQDIKQHMYQRELRGLHLKFIVSSRPYQDRYHPYEDLTGCSPNVYHLDGENAKFKSDIFNVVSFKANELARERSLTESTRGLLLDEIIARNKNTKTFLWVRLAFELLAVDSRLHPDSDLATIQTILAGIPELIEEQFETLLQTSDNPVHARKLFNIIVAARRPLKIDEFKIVYALTKVSARGDASVPHNYDALQIIQDDEQFKKQVRNTCGLFVTFVKNSVHLFHQTVREYLVYRPVSSPYVSTTPSPSEQNAAALGRTRETDSWKHSVSLQRANFELGKVCLDLICFDASETWVDEMFNNFALSNFRDKVHDYLAQRPFLMYAACNWYEHLTTSGDALEHDVCRRDSHDMFDISKMQFWVWFLIACDQVCLSQNISSKAWRDDVTSTIWTDQESFGRMDRGTFFREVCICNMSSMDERIAALLHDLPSSKTKTIIDGLPWTTTDGYFLVDRFHLANGDHAHTSASKAVSACEAENDDASRILMENVSRPTLIWMAICDRQPKALSKILADVTDSKWLSCVPKRIPDYPERQKRLVGDSEEAEKFEGPNSGNLNQQYASTFKMLMRVNAQARGDLIFSAIARWVETSSSPQAFAQDLWAAGGFINASLCRLLFRLGAQLDKKLWKDQMTALHIAATFWEHDCLQALLFLGADVMIVSSNGWNALHWFSFAQGGPAKESRRRQFSHRYKKLSIKTSFAKIVDMASDDEKIMETKDAEGITALMLAVRVSSTITKSLLEEGALVNQTDNLGRTALIHYFIGTESWGRPRSVMQDLLLLGADARISDKNGLSGIGYWARAVLSKPLSHLYAGYNAFNNEFHALDTHGIVSDAKCMPECLAPSRIPLIVAVKLGNAQLCKYLLSNGANANHHGLSENSPLVRNDGSEATALEEVSWNPLMVAIATEAYVTAALLLENGAETDYEISPQKLHSWSSHKSGTTPLHLLVSNNSDARGVSEMNLATGGLSAGCTFRPAGRPDQSVSKMSVHEKMAAYCHHHRFDKHLEGNSSSEPEIESVRGRSANDWTGSKLLPFDKIIQNADIRSSDQQSLYAMIYGDNCTASQKQLALAELIISRGASVNARTQMGTTPLLICAQGGRTDLARLLLSHQADPNSTTDSGCTSLMLASQIGNKDMVELLLDFGANVNAQTSTPPPESGHCYKFEAPKSANTFFRSSYCRAPITSLSIAAERGHYAVVQLLLDRGADPNMRIVHHVHGLLRKEDDKKLKRMRYTPHAADSESDSEPEPDVWKGYISVATALTWARDEVRDLLLERGADAAVEEPIRECGCVVKEI